MSFVRSGIRWHAFVLVVLLVPAALSTQDGTSIVSGRVLDDADESPVGLATVVVLDAESGEALSGTIAGEDGRFVVEGLPPGEYALEVSFPGFFPLETDVLVSELEQLGENAGKSFHGRALLRFDSSWLKNQSYEAGARPLNSQSLIWTGVTTTRTGAGIAVGVENGDLHT
jgi:hypothetical protein